MAVDARLLLIFFLFFTNQTTSLATGEDIHLLEFKEGLTNSSALDATWRNGTHPCQDKWIGVECEEHDKLHVSGLFLINLGLSGDSQDIDIDPLTMLQTLRIISLEKNAFSGPIPEFNRLTSLRSLYLSENQFSGEISQDFFNNMKSLKRLELARNNFTGRIPDSIGKLENLQHLFLSQNGFSGPVPLFAQQSLVELDMSYNKLQGEIPQNMSRFGKKPFEGNNDICGQILSKPCQVITTNAPPPAGGSSSNTKWVILCLVVAVLAMTILFSKSKKKEETFSILGKENLDEVVKLHIPNSKKSQSSTRRGLNNYNDSVSHSSKRGSTRGKSSGDLVMVNEEKGIFGMQDLMKAAAEVIGSGGMGSAYKAAMGNGLSVVVKRYRDMNKLNRDDFDNEVRRLGRIRHQNILPPLAYHYRKEEKLLVSEFVPKGSLMFLLHGDRGMSHAELTWPTRLKIIKGVARGMGFLHAEFANFELPHGNLKSNNILLSSNYEPLLTDYALYSLLSNTHSVQSLFSYKCPEAVLYQQLSPKSDVYCLGIVILEIMTGKFPSQKGGTDLVQWVRQSIFEDKIAELIDPEIVSSSDSLNQMEKMLNIGATCIESDHDKRIEMSEAIRNIEEVQV